MPTRVEDTPATYISTPTCPSCKSEYPDDVLLTNTRSSHYRITRYYRCENCNKLWHETGYR
jgi:DNA-directed RNA polymerase subunit M/transcription elongation factor TFIIS